MGNRVNTRRFNELRADFFEEGKRLDAEGDPRANCWLCLLKIDYTVEPNTTPDSHNLDHYYVVRDYPELQEDPENFRHSHQSCNNERGAEAPQPGIGIPSRDWLALVGG
ncbi:hypothetical protein AB0870_08315 [Microbacterium proteolyticum]|uniref:hypothetical protein n=1 Tax=Microbacterium proteolyticum TaxID=1572644 RepID=UPI00345C0126